MIDDPQHWQATVMLAANVGFLAIQTINVQAEIASSISLVFSMEALFRDCFSSVAIEQWQHKTQEQRCACTFSFYAPLVHSIYNVTIIPGLRDIMNF
jgi:hypothetical protein